MSDITALEAATACTAAAGAAECAPELYSYFHVYAASPGIALKMVHAIEEDTGLDFRHNLERQLFRAQGGMAAVTVHYVLNEVTA